MRLDDQLVDEHVLDALVGPDGRWPDPRALDQTAVLYLRDRTPVVLAGLDHVGATRLLQVVLSSTREFHEAAAFDDEALTSSALEWALNESGVPPVGALDPSVWVESTELVRWLRRRLDEDGLPV